MPMQPRDAARLLRHYETLSRAETPRALRAAVALAAVELANCAFARLYLLDITRTRLELHAEVLQRRLTLHDLAAPPVEHVDQPLLQYSLSRNRITSLTDLDPVLHDTAFLPAGSAWRSLSIMPLLDHRHSIRGLLVCADTASRELTDAHGPLTRLGTFMLALDDWHGNTVSAGQRSIVPAAPRAKSYGLIGQSPAMHETYRLVDKVLHSPYTVLLTGETGTGKELVARAIHDYGPRHRAAFVVQNCSALPEHLLESELFGYRKGAFTGADRDRAGLFDAADGGTLFLDEVGDMPPALQAKVLRALQEGEIRPLGSTRTHRVDVRIVAATHRNLRAMAGTGGFREDLYYRLAQFPIELPPLRQRGEDILHLARHFADRACELLGHPFCRWSDAALAQLAAYPFPGNVRELKAMAERAVLLCEGGELRPEHFNLQAEAPLDGGSGLRQRLDRVERTLLIDCLRKHGGNRTLAAKELGLARRTLQYRLGRLGIPPATT